MTSAEAILDDCEARATRIDTPCGEGTMAWRIWGADNTQAPPVILGHGGQGTWSHWIRNIDVLAAHYRVIAPDLPGHGDSAMPHAVSHDALSAALADAMPLLLGAGQQADFVGFSFGGAVFTHFAARHPEWVRRVVMVGTGGLDTPHGHVRIGKVSGLRGAEREAMIRSNLLGLMLHHPETVDPLAMHMLMANARAARLPPVDLVIPDKVVAVLPRVTVPIDAIWGEFDLPHPDPAVQEAVLRRFRPEMDFRVVAGAGHWVMYERAEAFNAALLDMLARPPGEVSR